MNGYLAQAALLLMALLIIGFILGAVQTAVELRQCARVYNPSVCHDIRTPVNTDDVVTREAP